MPLPPSSSNAPDLQVLIVSGAPGPDMVNVTYPGVADNGRLQNDIACLSQQLGANPGQARITNKALPMTGVSTPAMTSVTLTAPNVAPLGTGSLPVDRVIVGLRGYHRLEVTYIMPPTYRYTGFSRHRDQNVNVSLLQSGTTFTYSVTIQNPNFDRLNLIDTSATAQSPGDSAVPVNRNELYLVRAVGILFVVACAALVGWGVYSALSKLQ